MRGMLSRTLRNAVAVLALASSEVAFPSCGGSDSESTGDSGAPEGGSLSGCNFVASLDQSCVADSDCAFGIHQIDCCGSTAAVGFNRAERARFDGAEPTCVATYPFCGCDPAPTRTDSGEDVVDSAPILLACVSVGPTRRCKTYVTMRPPDGR
jgi:hypothetical protein